MGRRGRRNRAFATAALLDAHACVGLPQAIPVAERPVASVDGWSAPPAASGIAWRDAPGAATIVLPPAGARAAAAPAVLGAALVLAGATIAAFAPLTLAWCGGLLLGVTGAALLGLALCACHVREQVREIRDGLQLCRLLGGRAFAHRFVGKRFVEGIALESVVRLAGAATSETVVVRADTETWLVGAGLDPEGRAWLQRTLRQLACR